MALLLRCSNPFKGEALLFTDKLWKNGADLFVMHLDDAEALCADLGHDSAGNEQVGIPLKVEKVEILGSMAVVEIDLYQWLWLPGDVRRGLLLNYARRPDKDHTKIGDALSNLQDMKMNHATEQGDVVVVKEVHIPKRSPLKLVKWIDSQRAMVQFEDHKVEVDTRKCIEDTVDWVTAIQNSEVSLGHDLRNSAVAARSAVTPLLHDIEARPY